MGDVDGAWQSLLLALSRRWPEALRALRPPESEQRVLAAEARTGVVWPDELRALFRLQGGSIAYTGDAEIWPGGCSPLTFDDMVEQRARSVQMWADEGLPDFTSDPAGTPSGMFLPSFVPVALDGSGGYLIVDTRSGPAAGCVTPFHKSDADLNGSDWLSISDLLRSTAAAIEGTASSGGWVFDAASVHGKWGVA